MVQTLLVLMFTNSSNALITLGAILAPSSRLPPTFFFAATF